MSVTSFTEKRIQHGGRLKEMINAGLGILTLRYLWNISNELASRQLDIGVWM